MIDSSWKMEQLDILLYASILGPPGRYSRRPRLIKLRLCSFVRYIPALGEYIRMHQERNGITLNIHWCRLVIGSVTRGKKEERERERARIYKIYSTYIYYYYVQFARSDQCCFQVVVWMDVAGAQLESMSRAIFMPSSHKRACDSRSSKWT